MKLSISIKERDSVAHTAEIANKLRIEKCPLTLVTKQPLVTLLRALPVKRFGSGARLQELEKRVGRNHQHRELSKISAGIFSSCSGHLGLGKVLFALTWWGLEHF